MFEEFEEEGLKKSIKDTLAQTFTQTETEREQRGAYCIGRHYEYYNSPLQSYSTTFAETLSGRNLDDYLLATYENKKGELVGMELGGTGTKLFSEMPEGLFRKSVGICLASPKESNQGSNNHEVIEADMFSRMPAHHNLQNYTAIEKWIRENGKPDFIIERAVKPMEQISEDYAILLLKRWYKLLAPEGTIFIDFPFSEILYSKLNDFISDNTELFEAKVSITCRQKVQTGIYKGVFLRIRKLAGAPDSLDGLIKQDEKLD